MSNDRSPSDLVARVKDTLQAAASALAAASRPVPAQRFGLRTNQRRWHWLVIALAAAVAVSLALAIPYGLLHR
ncbi:hypothetical protein [Tenggerimyces flavus]|uniref:Uncharacterized protein n=1 Tax=Tenggerimyces flavus TaxID=1708749 RepID=A0ABV7YLZ9_9ACTN|nr:hypothetical protein [Tenggerimyces flavus]MBM7786278.1 anti-sigma-K factor RskA [Tenggerimyces flavus]